MPEIAGYTVTSKQLVALHGLYRGLVKNSGGAPTVYGVNVRRQLDALADAGVISRTGMGTYMIPFGSPGELIINASLDFPISSHI